MSIPIIPTDRLLLRPFLPWDAPTVQRLAGDAAVSRTTQNIPHPYEDGVAEKWIASHGPAWDAAKLLTLAVTLDAEAIVGAVSLHVNETHRRGELGYWVGRPYWGCGYATEAASALLEFGFDQLGLNRIQGRHMISNPASGRVMQKLGMKVEGTLRQQIRVWEAFEDVVIFAILRSDRTMY